MATSAQLKALVRSYADGDEDRFYTSVLQISAHEARAGHGKLATELKNIIDAARQKKDKFFPFNQPLPIVQPRGELATILNASYPDDRFSRMIFPQEIFVRLQRLLKEQRQVEKLYAHGLSPRRKLLMVGPPGTGKTMTASALAGELNLPLFVIRLDGVITKFMGETSVKLRLVFDAIKEHRGIYLFDEFDALGASRTALNDVGETRRILNSFLQLIDEDDSTSMLLAATNQPANLDYALFRRFDDVIEYSLPACENRLRLLEDRLAGYRDSGLSLDKLARESEGLSYAEITRACEDAIKEAIIDNRKKVTEEIVLQMLEERKEYHIKIFGNLAMTGEK